MIVTIGFFQSRPEETDVPENLPEKTKEKKTTRVDKLRPLPASFGSMILPRTIWTTTKPRTVRRADPALNWTRAGRATDRTAMIAPLFCT